MKTQSEVETETGKGNKNNTKKEEIIYCKSKKKCISIGKRKVNWSKRKIEVKKGVGWWWVKREWMENYHKGKKGYKKMIRSLVLMWAGGEYKWFTDKSPPA